MQTRFEVPVVQMHDDVILIPGINFSINHFSLLDLMSTRPKKKISLFPMKRPGDFFSALTRPEKSKNIRF